MAPRVGSAESGGLAPVNIGQIVSPGTSYVPGPAGGAPGSGSQGAGGGLPGQPASHGGRTHHSRGRTRTHPAAGMAEPGAAR